MQIKTFAAFAMHLFPGAPSLSWCYLASLTNDVQKSILTADYA